MSQKEITSLSKEKGYYVDKKGLIYNKKGKSLIISTSIRGYASFNIRIKGKNPTRSFLHRLQAYQKFGDKIFEEGIVVRHLDGNPLNNSWDNIAIGTQSDNVMDINSECRKKTATIASRTMQDSIRSYEDRCKIYEDLKNRIPYSEIMIKHKVSSKGTLSFMKNKSEEYKEYIKKTMKTQITHTQGTIGCQEQSTGSIVSDIIAL